MYCAPSLVSSTHALPDAFLGDARDGRDARPAGEAARRGAPPARPGPPAFTGVAQGSAQGPEIDVSTAASE